MAGRVPRGRFQPHLVRDPIPVVDQLRPALRHDGTNGIVHGILQEGILRPGEEVPFGAADQIPRVGERGDPLAVPQHRVPADVVDVQMRADDAVDRLARAADLLEIVQERQPQLVPFALRPELVVPDAGVDDDARPLRLDQERMDAHPQPSRVVAERRIEPVALPAQVLRRRVGHQDGAIPRSLRLDDASDLHGTDRPLVHGLRSSPRFRRCSARRPRRDTHRSGTPRRPRRGRGRRPPRRAAR